VFLRLQDHAWRCGDLINQMKTSQTRLLQRVTANDGRTRPRPTTCANFSEQRKDHPDHPHTSQRNFSALGVDARNHPPTSC